MQISVYCLQKLEDSKEISEYIKMSSKWATIKDINRLSPSITKAQIAGIAQAHKAYMEAYEPYVSGFCVGLDERGEMLDSSGFATLLKDRQQISFFIGGAYGLGESFCSKMSRLISLSRLTLAHKIAKLILYEQIFRGLCINANHPYHK